MAPKDAAKGNLTAAAAQKKGLLGGRIKVKSLPPKVKTMLIATFAVVCFFIFIGSTIGYALLALAEKNPLEEPLHKLRETLSSGLRRPSFIFEHYVTVADEVLLLPNHLAESKKAYGNRKAKYQSIFKKGELRSADEWEIFGRNIYYLSNTEKTWYDAENFCMSRDAHLASILTEDEQYIEDKDHFVIKMVQGLETMKPSEEWLRELFISSQLSHPTWIGLTDENVEGDWEWTDGSRVITQFWSQGNPELHDGGTEADQDCTAIEPSHVRHNWNDTDCHELKRWICKESLDIEEPSAWPNPLHRRATEY